MPDIGGLLPSVDHVHPRAQVRARHPLDPLRPAAVNVHNAGAPAALLLYIVG